MSALAVDYAAAPRPVRMPARPHLVLVPAGPAGDPVRSTQLRLTRSARLLVTSAVALLAAVTVFMATGGMGSAAPAPRQVTVHAGQTLSGIAAHELPSLPLADAIVRIQLANDLATGQVDAGQVLVIPAAG